MGSKFLSVSKSGSGSGGIPVEGGGAPYEVTGNPETEFQSLQEAIESQGKPPAPEAPESAAKPLSAEAAPGKSVAPGALNGPVSFGKNFATKVRKHIDQIRNRGSVKEAIPSPGQGGLARVEQIIRDRVAQGGGRATTYAGEAAVAFEDGGVTYIFRPNGEFWTVLGN